MSIVLFAIIGALIEAGIGYWICFAIYSVLHIFKAAIAFFKAVSD